MTRHANIMTAADMVGQIGEYGKRGMKPHLIKTEKRIVLCL